MRPAAAYLEQQQRQHASPEDKLLCQGRHHNVAPDNQISHDGDERPAALVLQMPACIEGCHEQRASKQEGHMGNRDQHCYQQSMQAQAQELQKCVLRSLCDTHISGWHAAQGNPGMHEVMVPKLYATG